MTHEVKLRIVILISRRTILLIKLNFLSRMIKNDNFKCKDKLEKKVKFFEALLSKKIKIENLSRKFFKLLVKDYNTYK